MYESVAGSTMSAGSTSLSTNDSHSGQDNVAPKCRVRGIGSMTLPEDSIRLQ
jgi:hypothetical protein